MAVPLARLRHPMILAPLATFLYKQARGSDRSVKPMRAVRGWSECGQLARCSGKRKTISMYRRPLEFVLRPLQAILLAVCLLTPGLAWADEVRGSVVSLALWSGASVFPSEAAGAAKVIAARYGHGGPVIVRSNTRRSLAAGPEAMMRALAAAEKGVDPARDVLFLVLTSHGSPQGIAERGAGIEGLLSPEGLRKALAQSRFRRKVLIVSACYAGIFLPLAGPDTLVITAADADHPSFGCEEGNRWTYFGDAFFNQALRRPGPLAERFADAQALIRAREQAHGFEPSNPQMTGGADVLPVLDAEQGAHP